MRVLGIETSADDTGVALIEARGGLGSEFRFDVLGNTVSPQQMHGNYGGIFPAMAKREHAKNLIPTLERTLREARILEAGTVSNITHVGDLLWREPEIFEHLTKFLEKYERPDIDCIAVTKGPGLEPCLWTGINLARVLADVWNVPVVGINHLEGHIVISMAENGKLALFEFPAVALLISGGHTELILMREFGAYEYIGRTRDDAVGEAFDKVARLLSLPYPGGPHISKLAEHARNERLTKSFIFPRPMLNEDNFDFSFSGLKTAVLRFVEQNKPLSDELKKKIAREFEDAAADVLVSKTILAVEACGGNAVIVGGGVSANKHIRLRLAEALAKADAKFLVCPPKFSTDNALMIALAGYFHALKKDFIDPAKLAANGNLRLA